MATYNIAKGQVAAHGIMLTSGQIETFQFTEDLASVDVISDGVAAVYYTIDGSTPTVKGANCYVLPSGFAGIDTRQPITASATTIKVISDGSATISVQRGS